MKRQRGGDGGDVPTAGSLTRHPQQAGLAQVKARDLESRSGSLTLLAGAQALEPSPAASQGMHQQAVGGKAALPELDADTLLWDAGIPNAQSSQVVLMIREAAPPEWFLQKECLRPNSSC